MKTAPQQPVVPGRFYTVVQLADLFMVGRLTIYNWIKDGKLPKPVRIGRQMLFPREAIERFIAKEQR
jgi:excisionase family DNA binding protein